MPQANQPTNDSTTTPLTEEQVKHLNALRAKVKAPRYGPEPEDTNETREQRLERYRVQDMQPGVTRRRIAKRLLSIKGLIDCRSESMRERLRTSKGVCPLVEELVATAQDAEDLLAVPPDTPEALRDEVSIAIERLQLIFQQAYKEMEAYPRRCSKIFRRALQTAYAELAGDLTTLAAKLRLCCDSSGDKQAADMPTTAGGNRVDWNDRDPAYYPIKEALTDARQAGIDHDVEFLAALDFQAVKKLLRRPAGCPVHYMSRTKPSRGKVHKEEWRAFINMHIEARQEAERQIDNETRWQR